MLALAAALWVMVNYGALKGDEDRSTLFAGVFLLSYVGSAIVQIGKQFDVKFGWGGGRKTAKVGAVDMIQRMGREAKKGPVIEEEGFTQADVQAVQGVETAQAAPSIEEEAAALKAELTGDRLGDDEGFGEDVQQGAAPLEAAPEQPPQLEAPPEPPKAEKPPEPKVEKAPEPKPERPPEKKPEAASPGEAQARQGYMAFVGEALNTAKREMPELNAFSRFGLNLYLAGACAAAGQTFKIGRQPQLVMLRDGLQAGGNSRERARETAVRRGQHAANSDSWRRGLPGAGRRC